MGNGVSAIFYIDQIKAYDSNSFIVWLNVMVDSGHIDSITLLKGYLEHPTDLEIYANQEYSLKFNMDFLRQKLGNLYMDIGFYDKARETSTESNEESGEWHVE